MNFDGKKDVITTAFGGLSTLVYLLFGIWYFMRNFVPMISRDDRILQSNYYFLDELDFTMDIFNDSFKYKFGIDNERIDILDNPYVSLKVYEYSNEGRGPRLRESDDI
jgi:hypothetical protein